VATLTTYFETLAAKPEDEIDLGRGALAIARLEYPELDTAGYLRRLDELAGKVESAPLPLQQIERLNRLLFEHEHFRGNQHDYYDPRNTFLNDVLDRRLGIPISLSVLYLEIAERVGLRLAGVGMPGHFLVKWCDAGGDVLIDPFTEGRFLSLEDCQLRLGNSYGPSARLEPQMLQAVSKRQILGRMLLNLNQIWMGRQLFKKALQVVQAQIALAWENHEALRQRIWLHAQLGDYRAALRDAEHFQSMTGEALDLTELLDDAPGAVH